MPDIGTISRRDKEGLQGRGLIVWGSCPGCGALRWTPIKRADQLCRVCSGKIQVTRPQFKNAKHKMDCNCQQCRVSRGELTGNKNPSWKGGRRVQTQGYVYILVDDTDPMRCMGGRDGYVLEHRLVMARHIGRPLLKNETVHHRNGDRTDNKIDNLELWVGNHGNGQREHDYHCPGCRCFEPKGDRS